MDNNKIETCTSEDSRSLMREHYFKMFQTFKFQEYFYLIHSNHAHLCNSIYWITALLISISSTLIWSISGTAPILWALVIAASQLALAMKDILPWSQQLASLNYFLPDLRSLLCEIENTWNLIELDPSSWDGSKINEMRLQYTKTFNCIENKFIGSTFFSENSKIIEQASVQQIKFFVNRYNLTEKENDKETEVK